MKIRIKKLHKNAVIPKYAKEGDAGMDLTCVDIIYTEDYIAYKTGLAFEIPEGYVGLLFPRSSNSKKDLLMTNSVGVVDAGYRGEVEARFKNLYHGEVGFRKDVGLLYKLGDRVAQIIIIPYPQIEFIESESLSDTIRGVDGFGSTN